MKFVANYRLAPGGLYLFILNAAKFHLSDLIYFLFILCFYSNAILLMYLNTHKIIKSACHIKFSSGKR
jgi:hypothetical protein